MNVKINLKDMDYEGNDEIIIKIEDNFVDKISQCYEIWDSLWNGGRSYETYEDYVEEYDEDLLVKDNFEKLVEATLSCGWYLNSLVNVINVLYPEAKAESLIPNYDCEFEFKY